MKILSAFLVLSLLPAAAAPARAGDGWDDSIVPLGSWIEVEFSEGGTQKTLWCRYEHCGQMEKRLRGSYPLFEFKPRGERKSGSTTVSIYRAATTSYTLETSIGRVEVVKGSKAVSPLPYFTRKTSPEGRYAMQVLPPKVCPPDCKDD